MSQHRENSQMEDNQVYNPTSLPEITEQSRRLQEHILDRIIGQNDAVDTFVRGYFQSRLQAGTGRKAPAAVFLFAGPPGVGKTYLASTAAEYIGVEAKTFDMTGYSDHNAVRSLMGFDKTWKDSVAGKLTGFVDEHPSCVLIFDEIEKANTAVKQAFLEILEGGTGYDFFLEKKVDFTRTIMIFTTNAGQNLYNTWEGKLASIPQKALIDALGRDTYQGEAALPAPLLSRFASNNVVMFEHMDAHSLIAILRKEMEKNAGAIAEKFGLSVSADDRLYPTILYSLTAGVDARTVRGKGANFVNATLMGTFRELEAARGQEGLTALRNIRYSCVLPQVEAAEPGEEEDPEQAARNKTAAQIRNLFTGSDQMEILVLTRKGHYESLKTRLQNVAQVVHASKKETLLEQIRTEKPAFAIIDLYYWKKNRTTPVEEYLSAEDIDTYSREAMIETLERYPDLPLYIMEKEERLLNPEEKHALIRRGVTGFINIDDENLVDTIREIEEILRQQKGIFDLTRSNRIVNFRVREKLSEDGSSVDIQLYDYEIRTSVTAEDKGSIVGQLSLPTETFDDIIGQQLAKNELKYFAGYLKNPDRYVKNGMDLPRGVLLYGPPGTGKTMFAKAMAHESGTTILQTTGSQILQGGVDLVHEKFAIARRYAPSILFIDEFDTIAEARGSVNDHRADILTTFLAEMDGFVKDLTRPVFVMAATNAGVSKHDTSTGNILDPAIVRRFDSAIRVDLPRAHDRMEFLKSQVKDRQDRFVLSEQDWISIVNQTVGFSFAKLENLLRYAQRIAFRRQLEEGTAGPDAGLQVSADIMDDALHQMQEGAQSVSTPEEVLKTARHEGGHAFLQWYYGDCPIYATVVARGHYGGYVQGRHDLGGALPSKQAILEDISVFLAGRAAEISYYGKENLSGGIRSDMVGATSQASRLIRDYGMSDRFGLAVWDPETMGGREAFHQEVNRILEERMQEAQTIIDSHHEAIDAFVDMIIQEGHLGEQEIDHVFRAHARQRVKNS